MDPDNLDMYVSETFLIGSTFRVFRDVSVQLYLKPGCIWKKGN